MFSHGTGIKYITDAVPSSLVWSGLVDYVVTPADGIILPEGTLKDTPLATLKKKIKAAFKSV